MYSVHCDLFSLVLGIEPSVLISLGEESNTDIYIWAIICVFKYYIQKQHSCELLRVLRQVSRKFKAHLSWPGY